MTAVVRSSTASRWLVPLGLFAAAPSVRAGDNTRLTNSVSLVSASYTGRVQDKVAQFDATFVVPTNAREVVLGIQLTRAGSNPSLTFADVVYQITP